MTLTLKQKKILDFIVAFRNDHGVSPTQQEIARHFGFSSLGTVQNYLVRLQHNGHLTKEWNAKRDLRITSSGRELPMLGSVAAGKPIEAHSHHETIEVPEDLLHNTGEHFALRVKGDSMVEDGILDGDLIVVRRCSDAVNGQTVVALIDGEATVKRYFLRQKSVELHPANTKYGPIVVTEKNHFQIAGVLTGVIRKLL